MKWNNFIGLMLVGSISYGQEVLSLQSCLDKVEENSLQTLAETNLVSSSKVTLQFHRWALLPVLNATAGINTSFGRRLDPFTNTFATSSVNSQSFGLNSSVPIVNGFSYFHKRNFLKASIERDETGLKRKLNELKIRAVETYLTLCDLSIQKQLTELRIEKYKQIQDVQRLLINEGRINAIDTLKSHYSLLNEQDVLVNLLHETKLTDIDLNFQMGLPLNMTHTVDISSVFVSEEKIQFEEVYQAELVEVELELMENQWKIERSKLFPVISLNGLVGTGFSTNNKNYLLAGTPTKPYSGQVKENLYEGIGFYLNIPLFNRGEWLKTRQLSRIKRTELTGRMELTNQLLEKRQLEHTQERLNLKAKLEQNKQQINNLEMIYTKSILLYREGRLTYPELEAALMEWQVKLVECERLKLDNQLLEHYEY